MPQNSMNESSFSKQPQRETVFNHPRMQREADTIEIMIRRYCKGNHQPASGSKHGGQLCPDCRKLLAYARRRLKCCPFQEGKTTCGKCTVHCYKPEMRQKIRTIMRRIGPRMLLTNPLLGIRHMIDGLRKKPKKKISIEEK